jgi:hypothetical protein
MAFDPSKPFKVIEGSQPPRFDPSKPFNVINQTQQPQQPGQPKVLKDGEGSDFTRGLGTYWDQIGGIFGGAQVLAGKAIDSDEQVMAGLERMQESEKAIGQRGTKASDSFTEAWEQGIGTVLTEFIPFIAGQGVGMVGEALATSIAGGMIGTAVAPGAGTAAGVLTGLVGKSLLKKGILEAAKDMSREEAKAFIKREAAKELASPAGQALIKKQYRDAGKKIALGGMAAKFGAGEVTGRAVDEAIANTDDPEEQLKIIQELNTGKLAGLSAAHALTDFFAIKIGLGSLDKLNPGSSSKLVNIIRNIGVTGLKEAPIEAAQTVLERMGADLDLTSQAAIKEYIDAAAAGFAMPIIPATIGGLRTPTNTTNPNAAKEAEEINPITGEPTKVTDNKGWSRTAEETKRQKENAKTATSVEDIDVNVDLDNANVVPTPIAASIEALITEENFNLKQIVRDKKISSNLKFATKELAQKAIALDPSLSMQYKVVINNDGTYRVEDNLGGGGGEGEEENVGLDNANVIPTPIKPPSEIPSIEEAKDVEGQIPPLSADILQGEQDVRGRPTPITAETDRGRLDVSSDLPITDERRTDTVTKEPITPLGTTVDSTRDAVQPVEGGEGAVVPTLEEGAGQTEIELGPVAPGVARIQTGIRYVETGRYKEDIKDKKGDIVNKKGDPIYRQDPLFEDRSITETTKVGQTAPLGQEFVQTQQEIQAQERLRTEQKPISEKEIELEGARAIINNIMAAQQGELPGMEVPKPVTNENLTPEANAEFTKVYNEILNNDGPAAARVYQNNKLRSIQPTTGLIPVTETTITEQEKAGPVYISSDLNRVKEYQKQNKLDDYAVREERDVENKVMSYNLVPRVTLSNTKVDTIADYMIRDVGTSLGREYEFTFNTEPDAKLINKFLKDTLNKEQYADISSRKGVSRRLQLAFKRRSPDEAQGGTPTQEKNVSSRRVREFDERVGSVPGYKELASEALSLGVAIPQFLKTGASFGSVRAPIVNATSVNDMFNAAMGDFIYETVADNIIANKERGESANVFLVNATKQDLARRKKLRDQFYNSPLFDAFLKRNNIEKNRSGFLRYDTSLDALVEKQKIKTRAANAYGDGRQILSSLAQTQRAINNEIKIIEDKKRNRLTAEELAVQEDLTDIAADLGISRPGTSNIDEMNESKATTFLMSIMGESKATTILKTSNNLQEALQRILAIQEQRLQTFEKNNDARANLIKAQTYLIERLMSVPGMQNVQVDAVSEAEMQRIQKKDPSTKGSSGLHIGYNEEAPNEPNKVIVLENFTSAQTIRILLHEAVHAATVFGLNTDRLTQAEQQNWTAIFNTAKKAARLEGVSFYGLKNIKEFVAEAFSSTEFQQWLSSIESVSNQPTNKYVSLFDDFVQAVKDLLGLGDINNTLLGDVVTASGRLFTFGPQPRQGDPRTEVIKKKMNWVKKQDRLDQGANPAVINIFYPDSEILELDAYEGDDDFLVTKIRRKPLTETQVRKTRSEEERLQDLTDVHERTTRGIFKKIWNFAARGNLRKQENVERIITNFSNKAYSVKKWQDDLRQSNLLLVGVEGFNDVFNQLTRAFGLADNYMKGLMAPLDKYGQDLAAFEDLYIQQNPGATQASARAYLQDTLTGLHEFERRQVRYILDAPLRTDKIIQLANGKTISPADLRVDIMKVITTKTWADPNERLNALKGYKEQLIKLTNPTTKISGQPTLDAIAGKAYLSDKVGGSIDIFSSSYDVSSLNAQTAESIRSRFKLLEASNPALYNSMNAVKNSMGVISTATKDLNAIGNYANQQALNIIDFYGWDNYIPLKSKRDQDSISEDIARILDPTSTRLSRSLKKLESSFEGNQQDAEQPFTQVIVDASLAAARAGRINYTQSIYNAITSEIDYKDSSGDNKKARAIDGSVKIFSYEQRYKNDPAIQEALAKQNTIIHFLDDGGMAVMTINDKKLLRAIREPLADKTPIIDIMNTITGSIGQLHTRFNPPFAPLNFVRDAITDIFLIGTDYGLKEAGGFIQNVANTIVKGGLIDTWKISSMYNQGKLKELDAFVATEKRKGNTYPETMVEYLNKGGIVSYSQALSNETAYQRIENMINRGKIFRSKESIKTFFDTYMATFELSTRVAAFSIIKDNYIAKNAPGKTGNSVPENVRRAAVEEATVYAKRLSNFEEIGEMGRTAGAFFMYFRPSAVGATRALESIAPALRNKAEVQATLPEYIRRSPERLAAWSADFDRRRSAGQGMIMGGLGFGMAMYYLSAMLAPGDDDEGENKILNDDLARWTRYARFDLSGLTGNKKDVIQIPWGFGLGGIPAIGAQMAGLISSNENTPASIFGNVIGITLDSFLPLPISRIDPTKHPMIFIMDSVVPTAARPMFEFMINKNAFGQGIYNELATKRFGSAYQAGDNVPQMYKDASIALAELTDGAVDWSPNIMHFFGNNYIDGITKIGQNLYGMQLALRGQKEFTPKGDLLLLDSFFSKYSDLDQRAYSRTVTDIENLEAKINLFKDTNPYEYNDILAKNPFAPTVIDYYNGMKSTLNDLNKQANIIRKQPGLNAKERSLRLEGIKDLQLVYKRNITAQIQMALEDIE